jgi:hypothetical protein
MTVSNVWRLSFVPPPPRQLLGQGSFGQVWRAVDRTTGRQLAVKIYKTAKMKNLELKKLVEAEVRSVPRCASEVAVAETPLLALFCLVLAAS